jgi:hypothetical protein
MDVHPRVVADQPHQVGRITREDDPRGPACARTSASNAASTVDENLSVATHATISARCGMRNATDDLTRLI